MTLTAELKSKIVYGITGAFILLSALLLYLEHFWVYLIPAALAVILTAFFRLDKLLIFITFCVPFSVNLNDVGGGFGLILPTEPLIFGAMVVFLYRVFLYQQYDSRILRHPLALSILFYLIWIFFTSIMSELPLVSFKNLLMRCWYIIPFYFVGVLMMRQRKNFIRFSWFYIVPMTGIIIYTTIRHATHNFDERFGHWVMEPFFNDHTSYGAMITFFIPIIFTFFYKKDWNITAKILTGFFFAFFLLGFVLSYTRAAWVSLAAALILWAFIAFKIRWWVISLFTLLIGVSFFSFQTEIMQRLEKNRQDSSGDIAEHVKSITNVATDASNLERINRWNSATKMYLENPVTGKGPGTYAKLYAPYQHSSDLTIISTNSGDLGTAHSEYFQALSEQGTPGLIAFLAIVILIFSRGIPLYYKLESKEDRRYLLAVILALFTYLTHSFLNNFLDEDKAAVPFWFCVAFITAMDIYGKKRTDEDAALTE